MKTALSIAGSDSSGGAGIQADIKTMMANGVYAMTAITALTAQNTTGVQGILEVPPAFLAQQLDAVFTDIRPDAVKIGMVSSPALIETIGERLRFYGARNIVLDPVMVATSGARLIQPEAVETLRRVLLPMALVATPNIPEAALLAGMEIDGRPAMEQAARRIGEQYGCAVLLKGGHSVQDANDLLYAGGSLRWFEGRRVPNPNTHGTGCTLSSAIAANLAKGFDLPQAVELAWHNAQLAEVDDIVSFEVADATRFHWGGLRGRVVTNPPYGERLMEKREAEELYRAFGRAMDKFPDGWQVSILSSHTEFERTYGKKADKKRKLYNGMLKCDLFQYGVK